MVRLSIIIPVFNESAVINRTIAHLSKIQGADETEIIVVDCLQHEQTLKVIRAGRVKKTSAPKGRGAQMNRGAAEASGAILLFLHADTFLPSNAYESIHGAMACGSVVGGAFRLGIGSRRKAFRIIEYAANLRSQITRIPYGDQAVFIQRDFFRKIGGFENIPIMEDIALMRRIKKYGGRIVILSTRIQTSPRRWEKEGIVRGTLRNWTLALLYYLGVPPQKLVKFYP